jgi:hypothetical protein
MSSAPKEPITPEEFEPYPSKVELRCQACGKKGKYLVGRILIDPSQPPDPSDPQHRIEDSVYFTGYFHCRHCGAGGPWEFTPMSKMLMIALLMEAIHDRSKARIILGRPYLFDGTACHTATEAEAYLQKLIDANPQDYFLHSRLGNMYKIADQPDLALAAYQKALELNPRDIETHHSMAEILESRGEDAEAAKHLHQVLVNARKAPERTRQRPELLRGMVYDALERLGELSANSGGAIKFLPTAPDYPDEDKSEPVRVLSSFELDMSKPESWEALTTFFLTGQAPATKKVFVRPPGPRALPGGLRPLTSSPVHVGRNDPCPCGSGKKFKHCCKRGS